MTEETDNLLAVGVPYCQPQLLALFDRLVDVIFCVKDHDGRYLAVNEAFVRRTGRNSKRDVLGGRAADFFPAVMAERYAEQDERVLTTGKRLRDELELIRREDGKLGWYVTTKYPIDAPPSSDPSAGPGDRPGLVSISHDLKTPSADDADVLALSRVVEHVRAHLDAKITVAELADAAGLSPAQLERRMRRAFGLAPSKYVTRARVNRAMDLLVDSDLPLADVAARSGLYYQANLTRQFARLTAQTPAQFRAARSRLRRDE